MTDTKTAWFFIVNPRAGSGKTMQEWVPAEQRLQKAGIPFTTALTDHKKHATYLAREAAADGYRKIVAVGGDGSVHEVLNGICQWCDSTGTPTEEFTIGVMPIGSGNDWIKSLGVPHDTAKITGLIESDSTGTMDVVKVVASGGKVCYMANIGGVGFDSHVCSRVNIQKEGGKRSKLIYLDSLRYTVTHLTAINIKVIADGSTVFEGPCFSVALGNGCYSGSGMRQVPLADMNDCMLDYMIAPRMPVKTVFKLIPRLFNGTVNEAREAISGRCRSLQIIPLDNASEDIFELDGEIDGKIPLSIVMEERKINVLKG